MILVNLLPHREEARKRRKQTFNLHLALAALVGLVLGLLGWMYYDQQISAQEATNRFIVAENAKLDEKIKEVIEVEDEIKALRDRQLAVESLQQQRNDPVKLFNEITSKMPDGVFLTAIDQKGDVVNLQGVAQSNERVSEYLRNMKDSELLARQPQLVESLVQEVTLSNKRATTAHGFKMALTLKKLEQEEGKKKPKKGSNK